MTVSAGVVVLGEADIYTAPELKEALAAAIETGATSILVDLSGATFIDSTTLGVLMGAVRRLRPGGGEVAIACADPNICRIFEITLLDRVFRIFPTPGEGLDHLLGVEQRQRARPPDSAQLHASRFENTTRVPPPSDVDRELVGHGARDREPHRPVPRAGSRARRRSVSRSPHPSR